MRRLKIAQVCTIGMTAHVLLRDQICMLKDMGHDVSVICSPGQYTDRLRESGLQVRTVELRREVRPIADTAALFALCHLFRQERFDVVHSHTPKAGLLAPLAARLSRIPRVVHTVHGLLFHDRMPRWKRGIFRLPEKVTAGLSDKVLFQSREDAELADKTKLCAPSKISFLGNGIDLGKFQCCSNNRGERRNQSSGCVEAQPRTDQRASGCVRETGESGSGGPVAVHPGEVHTQPDQHQHHRHSHQERQPTQNLPHPQSLIQAPARPPATLRI